MTAGKLNNVIGSDWTVERNSSATYIDKDGILRTAAPNVPRIDWSTGEPKLLKENDAINLADRKLPDWWKEDITIEGSIQSPDGKTIANKFVPSTSSRAHYIRSSTPSGEGAHTLSFFAKPSGYHTLFFNTGHDTSPVMFNLESLGASGANSFYSDPKITKLKNGWYRCSVVMEELHSSTGWGANIGVSASANTNAPGDGVSGAYIWGVQLEEGRKATSYIPTNGAIATRLVDNIYKENAQDLIGQSEGTVFVEVENVQARTSGLGRIVELYSNNGNFRISVFRESNIITLNSSPTQSWLSFPPQEKMKIAFTYGPNGTTFWMNGEKKSSSTVITASPILDEIALGNAAYSTSGTIRSGLFKSLANYKTVLSDAQLIEMTTL